MDLAFEGVVRATETSGSADRFEQLTKVAKLATSEIAESALQHVCRALGGSAYSRYSPFGWWHADVRAMGLIRPMVATLIDDLSDMPAS